MGGIIWLEGNTAGRQMVCGDVLGLSSTACDQPLLWLATWTRAVTLDLTTTLTVFQTYLCGHSPDPLLKLSPTLELILTQR